MASQIPSGLTKDISSPPVDFGVLPKDGFVRLSTILAIIPIGRSTWWEGVRTGRFPKPVKLGSHTTAWRASDISSLIRSFEK